MRIIIFVGWIALLKLFEKTLILKNFWEEGNLKIQNYIGHLKKNFYI